MSYILHIYIFFHILSESCDIHAYIHGAFPGTSPPSQLNVVDLAGSERQKKSQTSGSRLKEGETWPRRKVSDWRGHGLMQGQRADR